MGGSLLLSEQQVRCHGAGPAVASASGRTVPHPGLRWRSIAGESAATGLHPILLSGLRGSTERPWESGEFQDPGNVADIDSCDAARVLEEGWEGQQPSP